MAPVQRPEGQTILVLLLADSDLKTDSGSQGSRWRTGEGRKGTERIGRIILLPDQYLDTRM
jgi:hypothetical protein